MVHVSGLFGSGRSTVGEVYLFVGYRRKCVPGVCTVCCQKEENHLVRVGFLVINLSLSRLTVTFARVKSTLLSSDSPPALGPRIGGTFHLGGYPGT